MRFKGQMARQWGNALRVLLFGVLAVSAHAQAQEGRKILTQAAPIYPELAKRFGLSGTVKVQVVIAEDGQIKQTKVLGGHPLLVDATLDALKKWKYAPSNGETNATLEFNFHP
jgi:TonB family protein